MKYTAGGFRRLTGCCSHKRCVCGGHNIGHAKKNKHHHGTKQRLGYRKASRFIRFQKQYVSQYDADTQNDGEHEDANASQSHPWSESL